jgi:capsular polysaccharide biosynthesis protein
MGVVELLFFYKMHIRVLVLTTLLSALLGIAWFLLTPPKYIASGAFYVSRSTETVPSEFKYEGYYASLSSLNFAKTLAALIESDDIKRQILLEQKQPINRTNLKALNRAVSIKNPETQLVSLQTKASSPEQALRLWSSYKKAVSSTISNINTKGDINLNVLAVSEEPVVFQSFRSLPLSLLLGAFVGLFGSAFLLGAYFFSQKETLNEVV